MSTSPRRSEPRGRQAEASTDVAAAQDAALRYLAQRPRSEQEVRLRLRRQHVSEPTIEQVLERLRGSGLVDDVAFASYWLEQRRTFHPSGARLLRVELHQRGVSADLASTTADQLASSAEADAYHAASKRARRLATVDERTFKSRLGQLLVRRGFDWEVVSPVVEQLWRELNTSSGSGRAPTA